MWSHSNSVINPVNIICWQNSLSSSSHYVPICVSFSFLWGSEPLQKKLRWEHRSSSKFVIVERKTVLDIFFFQLCGFREYHLYAPHARSLKILNGVGEGPKSQKLQTRINWNFWRGGWFKPKHLAWGVGDILKYFFQKVENWKKSRREEMTRNDALPFSTQFKATKVISWI